MASFHVCQGYNMFGVTVNQLGDSGINIPVPRSIVVPGKALNFCIDLEAKVILKDEESCYPFVLMPRSSMGSKTPLILANSIGLIDKGYRGNLKAFVHNLSDRDYEITEGTSLFQVVSGDLSPWNKVYTYPLSESPIVMDDTIRGEKGFGSTGI